MLDVQHDVARLHLLDSKFAADLVKENLEKLGEKDLIFENGVLYSGSFVRREKRKLSGVLRATTLPTKTLRLVQTVNSTSTAVQDILYATLAELVETDSSPPNGQCVVKGVFSGAKSGLRGTTFTPLQYVKAREAQIHSEFVDAGAVAFSSVKAHGITNPLSFLQARYEGVGVPLHTVFVASSLIRASFEYLVAKIEAACVDAVASEQGGAGSNAGLFLTSFTEIVENASGKSVDDCSLFEERDVARFFEEIFNVWHADANEKEEEEESIPHCRSSASVLLKAVPADVQILGNTLVHKYFFKNVISMIDRTLNENVATVLEQASSSISAAPSKKITKKPKKGKKKRKGGGDDSDSEEEAGGATKQPKAKTSFCDTVMEKAVREALPKEAVEELLPLVRENIAAKVAGIARRIVEENKDLAHHDNVAETNGIEKKIQRLWQLLFTEAAFVKEFAKQDTKKRAAILYTFILKTTAVRFAANIAAFTALTSGETVLPSASTALLTATDTHLYLLPLASLEQAVLSPLKNLAAVHTTPVLSLFTLVSDAVKFFLSATEAEEEGEEEEEKEEGGVKHWQRLENLLQGCEGLKDSLGVYLRVFKPREVKEMAKMFLAEAKPSQIPTLNGLVALVFSLKRQGFIHALPNEMLEQFTSILEKNPSGVDPSMIDLVKHCVTDNKNADGTAEEGEVGISHSVAELAAALEKHLE